MKAKSGFREGEERSFYKLLVASLLFLAVISCQKSEINPKDFEDIKEIGIMSLPDLSSDCSFRNPALYFGHIRFTRNYGSPVTETKVISNPDFSCFRDFFVLKIKCGMDKRTRVASGEIWIDEKLIVRQSDFNKRTVLIVKHIYGLKPESKLEVKLTGTPGSYIDLWIEGEVKKVIPAFEQIGPLCQYSEPPLLPENSLNDPPVTGTWSPQIVSTSTAGKTIYTFTPDGGQCGSVVRMEIEVTPSVIPVFDQMGPFTQGADPTSLPVISTNGVTGTWIPDRIITEAAGNFKYTFTPDPGQCSSTVTMDIIITEPETEGTVTDIDGNVYKTIKIGDQWWMAENLKTTRYNNGDLITTTTPVTFDISAETEPKYQWAYNGVENNTNIYGRLYTWYAATEKRGVCPTGWHLPNDAEWTILTLFLTDNGYGFEGSGNDIAKSMASTSGWRSDAVPGNVGNDQASNNKSGFAANPAGSRLSTGIFSTIEWYTPWWCLNEGTINTAWFRGLYYNSGLVSRGNNAYKKDGASIRCVKD